jgi:hypothetical protein
MALTPMQRYEQFIQSRLATVTSVIDEAIAEGKTSFVFYLPAGVISKKPSKLWDPTTWGQIEVTGCGTQLIKILEDYGLDTNAVLYPGTGEAYILGYIKGTKPVDYGNATSLTWLDRPGRS